MKKEIYFSVLTIPDCYNTESAQKHSYQLESRIDRYFIFAPFCKRNIAQNFSVLMPYTALQISKYRQFFSVIHKIFSVHLSHQCQLDTRKGFQSCRNRAYHAFLSLHSWVTNECFLRYSGVLSQLFDSYGHQFHMSFDVPHTADQH